MEEEHEGTGSDQWPPVCQALLMSTWFHAAITASCQVRTTSTLFIRVGPSDANPSFLGPTARVLGTHIPGCLGCPMNERALPRGTFSLAAWLGLCRRGLEEGRHVPITSKGGVDRESAEVEP